MIQNHVKMLGDSIKFELQLWVAFGGLMLGSTLLNLKSGMVKSYTPLIQ